MEHPLQSEWDCGERVFDPQLLMETEEAAVEVLGVPLHAVDVGEARTACVELPQPLNDRLGAIR